jgi:RNA polymerase sigma factor (sigma-70 family)
VIRIDDDELLRIWNDYSSRLRSRMGALAGYSAPLDDLLQDLFVKIYRNAEKLERGHAPRYMMRAASNLARDYLRKIQRQSTPEPGLSVVYDTPDETLQTRERQAFYSENVVPLIERLPEANRQAIRAFLTDRPRDRNARDLGIPSTTLRSREIAGINRLREQLGYEPAPRNGYRT